VTAVVEGVEAVGGGAPVVAVSGIFPRHESVASSMAIRKTRKVAVITGSFPSALIRRRNIDSDRRSVMKAWFPYLAFFVPLSDMRADLSCRA
jgi:hypothetical protein